MWPQAPQTQHAVVLTGSERGIQVYSDLPKEAQVSTQDTNRPGDPTPRGTRRLCPSQEEGDRTVSELEGEVGMPGRDGDGYKAV